MKTIAIIPVRMGSSRFPGKPLANICGRSMVEHVYRRTVMSEALSEVIVATCDNEIKEAVEAFGGNVAMTSSSHDRASDRIAEAAEGTDADVIVLVQGDEPMTYPEMIDAAVAPFEKDPDLQCVNLTKQIETEEDFRNPNTIKVVLDAKNNALYMSRQPIPTVASSFENIKAFKQVCIIPFRRDALDMYTKLEPTPLEIAESIDMMRFIENNVEVHMVETGFDTHAVDTKDDLIRVEKLLAADSLINSY